MSTNNPLLLRQLQAEHQISGIPFVISSTTSAIRGHYFSDGADVERETNYISITNTGLSNSLGVSFVSGGFATGQSFTLAPQETFSKTITLSKIYVSGNSGQKYEIVAGLTGMEDKESTSSRFLPTDISDVYAWWRADTGVELSSTSVVSWTDSVGGHVVSQSNASYRPTYNSSYISMNNKPVFIGAGVNQRLISNEAASTWAFLNGANGSTIAVAGYSNATTSQGFVGTDVGGTGRTGRCLLFNHATANNIMARTYVSGVGNSQQQGAGYTSNFNSVYAIHGISQGGTALKASGLTYVSAAVSFALANLTPESTLTIGHTNGHNYFNGSYAEIIIYSRKLSEIEMNKLSEYFVKRYGCCI